MKGATIGERWIESCKRRGNPVLIRDTLGTTLNASAALTASIVLARRIRRISPEQTVAALLPTSAGAMVLTMAAMLLGRTLVLLNFTAGREAMRSAIEQAGIETLYTSARFLDKLRERGIDTDWLGDCVNVVLLENLSGSISKPEKALTLLLSRLIPAALLKKLLCRPHDPDLPAVILFSSGSEGHPKGIILSHRNILTNIDQVMATRMFRSDDVMLANLPIFHAFGLTATVFLPLLERIATVCHADPTDTHTAADVISRHRVSVMFGTSTFLRLYVRNERITREQLDSLRLVVAGAEKLQPDVRRDFFDKFRKEILEGYGATETSPVVSVNLPDARDEHDVVVERRNKPGSVGRPLTGTRIRIVDPETHEPLPDNRAGLILVSGGQVMQGYLAQQDKTAAVLREVDGETWYVTGDKGYLDADGFLHIEDRYSRFAKVGGEMIGLARIESAVRDARDDPDLEVVAVALPDPRKGEAVVLLSTGWLDFPRLRNQLRAAGVPTLALPAAYYKIDAIPCLGSGKTDFTAARALARQRHHGNCPPDRP